MGFLVLAAASVSGLGVVALIFGRRVIPLTGAILAMPLPGFCLGMVSSHFTQGTVVPSPLEGHAFTLGLFGLIGLAAVICVRELKRSQKPSAA